MRRIRSNTPEAWSEIPPSRGARGRIDNRTSYRDEDVRKFVQAGLRAYGAPPNTEVTVRAAPGRTRGCAILGGRRMVLALARPSKWSLRKATLIFRHEVAHLRGADHHEMSPDIYWSRGPVPAWARGKKLRRKSGAHRGASRKRKKAR
jgi:hypothetical protein